MSCPTRHLNHLTFPEVKGIFPDRNKRGTVERLVSGWCPQCGSLMTSEEKDHAKIQWRRPALTRGQK